MIGSKCGVPLIPRYILHQGVRFQTNDLNRSHAETILAILLSLILAREAMEKVAQFCARKKVF